MKHSKISVVNSLVIINVLMFILQAVLGNKFTNSLLLASEDVFVRPWILLTSMFLHGGLWHLFFNMYVLFMFGSMLESRLGKLRFLGIYIVSGLVAGFMSTFFYPYMLGASGAISGIFGVLVLFIPNMQVALFAIIPMTFRTAVKYFIVIDSILFFLDIFGIYSIGIASFAHLVGLACGIFYGYLLLKGREKFFTVRKKNRIHIADNEINEYIKYGRL